jgi:hypothetical protein
MRAFTSPAAIHDGSCHADTPLVLFHECPAVILRKHSILQEDSDQIAHLSFLANNARPLARFAADDDSLNDEVSTIDGLGFGYFSYDCELHAASPMTSVDSWMCPPWAISFR